MDLNESRIFAAVAEHGSFRGAGKALDVPKSTVSRKVADLEERLGARLLQRTTRQISLTDAGIGYLDKVRRALSLIDEAEREAADAFTTPRGQLKITAPFAFGEAFLHQPLSAFLLRYPQVHANVLLTDRQVDLVEEGFDVAIRIGELADSTLIARELGRASGGVFASPTYLEGRAPPEHPNDLVDHEAVAFSPSPTATRWVFREGKKNLKVEVTPRVMLNNLPMVYESVVAGLGVGWLPFFIAGPAWRDGRLVRLLEDFTPQGRPFWAVYPSRRVSAAVRAFLDVLTDSMTPAPWNLSAACDEDDDGCPDALRP